MNRHDSFRIDFDIEIVDPEKRLVAFIPRSDRFDWYEEDGVHYLRDNMDGALMRREDVIRLLQEGEGTPIYFQPSQLSDPLAYAASRKQIIREHLAGGVDHSLTAPSVDEFLSAVLGEEIPFVMVSVDVVGSTMKLQQLGNSRFGTLINAFEQEASALLPHFSGRLLKFTGDGVLCYFAPPSYLSKNDLAAKYSLALMALLEGAFNDEVRAAGYEDLRIRIGMDSGEALVISTGIADLHQIPDLVGEAVSFACKIQSLGEAGTILMGDVTLKNLHTTIRHHCEPLATGPDWKFKDSDGNPYKLHRLNAASLSNESDHILTLG